MPVSIIASYDIVDPKEYESYVPGVIPLLQKHGARVIVADYGVQVLEGEKRSVHVVIQFDSEEAALRWYHDPAYEPVRKLRLDSCTNHSLVLARQWDPPDGH